MLLVILQALVNSNKNVMKTPAFWYCDEWSLIAFKEYGLTFSHSFCSFYESKVSEIMLKEANLKPSTRVGLSAFYHEWVWQGRQMYEPGKVSRINTELSILPGFQDQIAFCWRTKSGNLVKPNDESVDEADLECWIEGLKPKLYWDYLNQQHNDYPFKVKNLPFPVVVKSFDTHCTLQIYLNDSSTIREMSNALSHAIEKHNLASEKKERADGVVHNSRSEIADNQLDFHIDLGSAGPVFIKKLLKVLAKFREVEKVEVTI